MALSEANKAAVRYYLGWSARYLQTDSRLENAMLSIVNQPESEALITNAIGGSPPGLVALLQDVDTQIRNATKRFKADKVGSVELNRTELSQLRSLGRQYVLRLATMLGVGKRNDVYGTGQGMDAGDFGPGPGGNYVGV